ncbi:MAG: hypothetical protein AAF226_06135 [Verrucomicrobiota bacterium]
MFQFLPFLLAFFIAVLLFFSAFRFGVTRLLASGIAIFLAITVFLLTIHNAPRIIEESPLGFVIPWEINFAMALTFAVFVYMVGWVLIGWFIRAFFKEGRWLQDCRTGVIGGILSLVTSLAIFCLIVIFIRVAGSMKEISYVAALSQPNVENSDTSQYPEWPSFTRFRDGVEKFPGLSGLLEKLDPIDSISRKNGALVIANSSPAFRHFLSTQTEYADVINSGNMQALSADKRVVDSLRIGDNVGLLLHDPVRDLDEATGATEKIKALSLEQLVKQFIAAIDAGLDVPPPVIEEEDD